VAEMREKPAEMREKPYTGPVAAMRDSPWLASEDLENPDGTGWREVTVVIDKVMEITDAQFKGGRSKKRGYALQFVNKSRMLYLNGVNRETLKEMFGRLARDWLGKTVTLWVKPDVLLMGQRVPGIRVKQVTSASPPPRERQPGEDDDPQPEGSEP